MKNEDAHEYVRNFDPILKLLYLVFDSLQPSDLPDERWLDCIYLTHKVFLHAATVKYLALGTDINVKESMPNAYAIDFSSVFVIARAAIETYLKVFEVFFEPSNADIFNYRHAVFTINGFKLRENFKPYRADPEFSLLMDESNVRLQSVREALKTTECFRKLDAKQQSNSLQGRSYPRRKLEEVAVSAGFLPMLVEQQFAYFSAFTHGDSLSVAQIGTSTWEQKYELLLPAQILIMMAMSKLILNYYNRFERVQPLCAQHRETMLMVIVTDQLAATLGTLT